MIYYMIFHLFACIWFFLGTYENKESRYPDSEGMLYFKQGWIFNFRSELNVDDYLIVYLQSLYFVVTTFATVGYGDVLAKDTVEYVYVLLLIMSG